MAAQEECGKLLLEREAVGTIILRNPALFAILRKTLVRLLLGQ
jgi:hypothetical protein